MNDINKYNIITDKEFKKLNITIDQLLEVAKKNVNNKIFSVYKEIPLSRNKEKQVIIPFDADVIIERGNYNFWTSMVLIREFWDKKADMCIERNWNKYYIAMPYRTFLIIGNADEIKSKNEILRLIDEYKNQNKDELLGEGDFEAAQRSISNDIYIMDDCKLKKVND